MTVAMADMPRTVIAAAWNAWLETDDHKYTCIGYAEGQWCCAEVGGPTAPAYEGRQGQLLDLAFEALSAAGYEIVKRPIVPDTDPS